MIAEVLHKVAAMEHEEKGEHAYYPRPSIAGPERCLRQMVYWARGEKGRPLPGRSIVVMDDSSWHEELTADLIRKTAFELHSHQMPVTLPNAFPWREAGEVTCHVCGEKHDKRDAHGHTDFIISDPVEGRDILVEHKALSHFSWEALADGELPLDYLTQMAIYLRSLMLVNPELNTGLLLAKNKNTSGYLEFECGYDFEADSLTVKTLRNHVGEVTALGKTIDRIVQDALDRFRLVDSYVAQQKLPLRQYQWDHWRCDYCAYNELCWSGYVAEHQTFKTDEKIAGWAHQLLRKYRELGDQESQIKKERDALKGEIKNTLTRLGVREGIAGNLAVKWSVSTQRRVNQDKIPAHLLEAAKEDSIAERLTVREIGAGKQQKGAKK